MSNFKCFRNIAYKMGVNMDWMFLVDMESESVWEMDSGSKNDVFMWISSELIWWNDNKHVATTVHDM